MMKGLPLAYNKDMQEDKEALFDAIDQVKLCLPVFTDMLKTMKVNTQKMREFAAKRIYQCNRLCRLFSETWKSI